MSQVDSLNALLRSTQFFQKATAPQISIMQGAVVEAWSEASQSDRDDADPTLVCGLVSTFLNFNDSIAVGTYDAITTSCVTPKTMIGRRVVGGLFRIVGIDQRHNTVKLEIIEPPRLMAAEHELHTRRRQTTDDALAPTG